MRALAEVVGPDVPLVEDACHALGLAQIGATSQSRMACFSTHPVKAISTGEGGLVTCAQHELARRLRELRSHGMIREASRFKDQELAFDGAVANPWYYEMHEIGANYRLPDILCALGLSQLRKLDRFHCRRVEIAALYDRLLAPLAPILRPVARPTQLHGWHLYVVLIDFAALNTTRATFMRALRSHDIGSQVHYVPVHRQPYYRDRYGDIILPGADAYYRRCLSIPIYPSMTDEDVERVAHAIVSIVG